MVVVVDEAEAVAVAVALPVPVSDVVALDAVSLVVSDANVTGPSTFPYTRIHN